MKNNYDLVVGWLVQFVVCLFFFQFYLFIVFKGDIVVGIVNDLMGYICVRERIFVLIFFNCESILSINILIVIYEWQESKKVSIVLCWGKYICFRKKKNEDQFLLIQGFIYFIYF